jgi:Glycogen recognition site of AMP-activated protein kinase
MAQTCQVTEDVMSRKMDKADFRNGGFSTILQVRPGTHRFHFLVDGEWRISNEFATAVDSEGNLLNYLEAAEYHEEPDIEYSGSVPTCIALDSTITDVRARGNRRERNLDERDTKLYCSISRSSSIQWPLFPTNV